MIHICCYQDMTQYETTQKFPQVKSHSFCWKSAIFQALNLAITSIKTWVTIKMHCEVKLQVTRFYFVPFFQASTKAFLITRNIFHACITLQGHYI